METLKGFLKSLNHPLTPPSGASSSPASGRISELWTQQRQETQFLPFEDPQLVGDSEAGIPSTRPRAPGGVGKGGFPTLHCQRVSSVTFLLLPPGASVLCSGVLWGLQAGPSTALPSRLHMKTICSGHSDLEPLNEAS